MMSQLIRYLEGQSMVEMSMDLLLISAFILVGIVILMMLGVDAAEYIWTALTSGHDVPTMTPTISMEL